MDARPGPRRLRRSNVPEQAGCVEGDKPAEAPAASRDGGKATAEEGQRLTKLPVEEVEWIMNHNPRVIEHEDEDRLRSLYPQQEEFEKARDTMRRAVEAAASAREEFLAYQAWVRAEYNDKGYVAVDDAFLAGREEFRQWSFEIFDEMLSRMEAKFSPADIGDYSDMYATDDE